MYCPTRSASVFVLARTPAVDVKACVAPGEKPLRPCRAEEFPANKKRQHLAAEDLGQARIIKGADFMESAGLVHPALGHQVMQMGMKIDGGLFQRC